MSEFFNKNRLVLAMKRRKISCHDLAVSTGINPSKLYRFMKGITYPNPDIIQLMAEKLNFPVGFLYGNDIEGPTFSSLDIHYGQGRSDFP